VAAIDKRAEAVLRRRFNNLPKGTLRLSTEGPAEELVDEVVAYALRVANEGED
jgi:hypothetical protein